MIRLGNAFGRGGKDLNLHGCYPTGPSTAYTPMPRVLLCVSQRI